MQNYSTVYFFLYPYLQKMEEIFHVEITNSCSKSFYIYSLYVPLFRKAFDCIKLVLEHSNGSRVVEGHRTFNYSLSPMYI